MSRFLTIHTLGWILTVSEAPPRFVLRFCRWQTEIPRELLTLIKKKKKMDCPFLLPATQDFIWKTGYFEKVAKVFAVCKNWLFDLR